MKPIVRVSILRCDPNSFLEMREMMIAADPILRPGIEAMLGLLAYYGGADEATSSLTNVSVWVDLASAKQMDGARICNAGSDLAPNDAHTDKIGLTVGRR